jgi:hypothetical protein
MGKICLVNYDNHTPERDNLIIANKPDMQIDNTIGGMWHTPNLPDKFKAVGVKFISYGDGSYETRPLMENFGYIDAIAKEGCDGFFLDQVSNNPNPTQLAYIKAISDKCRGLGLQVIFNTGTPDWSEQLMTLCDYMMSEEMWYPKPLTRSQEKWKDRVILVSNNCPNLAEAIDRTEAAFATGIGFHYSCMQNNYHLPLYYPDYIKAVKVETPPVDPPVESDNSSWQVTGTITLNLNIKKVGV